MNTLGKAAVAENGRTTNDRIIILDAGAQYGKVRSFHFITKRSINEVIFLGH